MQRVSCLVVLRKALRSVANNTMSSLSAALASRRERKSAPTPTPSPPSVSGSTHRSLWLVRQKTGAPKPSVVPFDNWPWTRGVQVHLFTTRQSLEEKDVRVALEQVRPSTTSVRDVITTREWLPLHGRTPTPVVSSVANPHPHPVVYDARTEAMVPGDHTVLRVEVRRQPERRDGDTQLVLWTTTPAAVGAPEPPAVNDVVVPDTPADFDNCLWHSYLEYQGRDRVLDLCRGASASPYSPARAQVATREAPSVSISVSSALDRFAHACVWQSGQGGLRPP